MDKLNQSLSKTRKLIKKKNHILKILINFLKKKRRNDLASEKVSKLKMDFSSLEQSNQFIFENVRRVKREIEKLYDDIQKLKERNSFLRTSELVEERKEIFIVHKL